HFIIGNGDRETVAAKHGNMSSILPPNFRESLLWNSSQLSAEDEKQIGAWPLTELIAIAGIGDVVFCHATPRNDVEIFTSATDQEKLLPIFEPLRASLVVCGHTHIQFDRHVGGTRVINPGSVGMPFQKPGAYWLLIGAGIELRHTAYDLQAAADRVRATAYPLAEEFAARNILAPPDEAHMIAALAKAELK
ncbi:MAG: metallophosphoesterase family protein, partial [Acidobacteriota bacterium]